MLGLVCDDGLTPSHIIRTTLNDVLVGSFLLFPYDENDTEAYLQNAGWGGQNGSAKLLSNKGVGTFRRVLLLLLAS